jgi:hypothetical protein
MIVTRGYPTGIVLAEEEYVEFMGEFLKLLYRKVRRMKPENLERMLNSSKVFEDWLRRSMVEWFDTLLDELNADCIVVQHRSLSDWNPIFNGQEFYRFNKMLGVMDDLVEELKERLGI